jgi:hypothetical protein
VIGQLPQVQDRARREIADALQPVDRRDRVARAGVEKDPVGLDGPVADAHAAAGDKPAVLLDQVQVAAAADRPV